MKPFSIKTEITEYGSFKEYLEEESIGSKDLFLISRSVLKTYPEVEKTGANIIFPRDFGAGEPTDEMVDRLIEAAAEICYDRIIAIGGGAILDMAKLAAVAEPGDNTDALYERGEELKKHCRLVLIPTTCGTGSEVTNISVINRVSKGVKMGLAVSALFADQAVIIPDLALNMPYQVFATSSIDAMVHSVESYLSPNRCSISELFSEKALCTIIRCWKNTAECGEWKDDAVGYLRASTWAGIGFGYGGCAAVHACAYPLGAVHHIPHGQSNQLMFASVMNKYIEKSEGGRFDEFLALLAEELNSDKADALNELFALMDRILPSKPLKDFGVTNEELSQFADNVAATQARLLKNNYVPLSRDDIFEIYKMAY